MAGNYRKVTEFKTLEEFSAYLKSENIEIGLSEEFSHIDFLHGLNHLP